MPALSANIHKRQQHLLDELPEKITSIVMEWRQLSRNDWDQPAAKKFFTSIQDLAEASERLNLFQISETLVSFEIYLSSFIDSGLSPNSEQLLEANRLIKALQHTWENFEPPEISEYSDLDEFDLPDQNQQQIYYFRAGNDIAPDLVPELESQNSTVLTFIQADDLLAEIEKEVPQVFVFDLNLLGSLKRVIEFINHHNKDAKQQTHLLCLSQSNSIKLNLEATRCGVEAFYAQPFNVKKISQQIIEWTLQDDELPYRVVVVDDDPAQADFATSVLQRADIETVSVTQPLNVLEVLYDFKPDLILMDIYMPEANGIELTTAIRTHSEFMTTPIVFLSGEQNADKQLSALSVGGDDFIAKPIRPNRLISSVTNRIKRHRELQKQSRESASEAPQRPVAPPIAIKELNTNSTLFKRDQLFDHLSKLVSGQLTNNHCAGFVHFEVGNLDEIREGIGRTEADELMNVIGQYLIEQTESGDVVARLGNAVFAVVAERLDEESITLFAEQLLNSITESHFTIDGFRIHPICYVGVRPFNSAISDISTIISEGELASEEAKKSGGNQVVIHPTYEPIVPANSVEESYHTRLQDALRDDSFQVVSRIFNNPSDESEIKQLALTLPTGTGGLHKETDFIPAAREAGLIEDIDLLITRQALSLLDFHRHQGENINILIKQNREFLADQGRIPWIREQLRNRQLVGTGLIIGLNLQDIVSDMVAARGHIEALQKMGIAVAILRFKPNSSALKVLRFLNAEYVVMSRRYLGLDRKTVDNFMEHAHRFNAKVIIPHVSSARIPTQHWLQVGDYCQMKGANPTSE
ncbi:MAG: response regulator [Candidatus Polarisedimenticolaceae bacterium]|nr:response regulator [Candidatus Polarisedimenticolaceae bacterium]